MRAAIFGSSPGFRYAYLLSPTRRDRVHQSEKSRNPEIASHSVLCDMVDCPICGKLVKSANINVHIDSSCESHIEDGTPDGQNTRDTKSSQVSSFFRTPSASAKKPNVPTTPVDRTTKLKLDESTTPRPFADENGITPMNKKRPLSPDQHPEQDILSDATNFSTPLAEPPTKKPKVSAMQRAAPLAERMRPRTLDEVCGQDLVGPEGVLRGLIETDRVPSMILWGGAGTGKTTIARVIAHMVGSRFVEINSTSSGVAECKKLFAEAKNELGLTGRKTIIFCDEIHRFSKSQQDVFLGPVESGQVTLIGATTENPSFKVQNALLSRCRTFTLQKLGDDDIEKSFGS